MQYATISNYVDAVHAVRFVSAGFADVSTYGGRGVLLKQCAGNFSIHLLCG
jgi:hypothetical protein